jgi:hypothetical protein
LATEPVLELTEVQARLEYSNFNKLISDFQTKLQNFDCSEQSVLERKTELLLLLRNLQDYFHKLLNQHSLRSPADLAVSMMVDRVLESRHKNYSDVPTQDLNSEFFSGVLGYASNVLKRISQFFPFVTEENSSTD